MEGGRGWKPSGISESESLVLGSGGGRSVEVKEAMGKGGTAATFSARTQKVFRILASEFE